MNKQSIIKTILHSCVFSIVFLTIVLFAIKVMASLNTVSSGTPLSASTWNDLIGNLFWKSNSNSIYYMSGNVGIGTTNPQTLLEVRKNADSTTELSVYNTTTSSNAVAKISVGNNPGYGMEIFRKGPSADIFFNATQGNGNIRFQDAGVDTFSISYDGNIGIGTTAPSEKLDVNGVIKGQAVYGRRIANSTNNNSSTDQYYIWGSEYTSTNGFFTRSGDNKSIILNKAGVYLIIGNILQRTYNTRCDVYLYAVNTSNTTTTIGQSLSPNNNTQYYKHHFSEIVTANAGDQIKVFSNTTTDCRIYSDGSTRTTLNIYKLN